MASVATLYGRAANARNEMGIAGAFVTRNFRDWASNRTSIVLNALWIVFYSGAWGIFATVALSAPSYVEKVQLTARSPVDFILIGQVATVFFWSTRGNLTWLIRGRSFANLWTAPISFATVVVGGNGWRYTWLFLESSLWVVMGTVLFGMSFHIGFSVVFVLLGGFLIMQSLELIAAGTTIVTKAGQDPVNWFLDITSMLVTGVMFPVEFLPKWLRAVSAVHPQRYLLDLARKTLSLGAPLSEVWPDIVRLMVTGTVTLMIGILVFRWGFNRARREGTIGHE